MFKHHKHNKALQKEGAKAKIEQKLETKPKFNIFGIFRKGKNTLDNNLEDIKEDIASNPDGYTAWFKIIFERFYDHLIHKSEEQ